MDPNAALMSENEFKKKALLNVSPPGFGWYKVRVGWITPKEDILARPKKSGEGTFTRYSVRLATTERAVFTPDPEREDNALFESAETATGGFFVDVFLGGKREREALNAMGRKMEHTGTNGEGTGPSPNDIHAAWNEGECWVNVFHGVDWRDDPCEVPGKWYSTPPKRTFVHQDVRERFLSQQG